MGRVGTILSILCILFEKASEQDAQDTQDKKRIKSNNCHAWFQLIAVNGSIHARPCED